MLVEFETLPDTSRVWVYQASRSFNSDELTELKEAFNNFITDWTAHGQDLKAGYEMRYNRFIILALDQSVTSASGCSIDTSVHFI